MSLPVAFLNFTADTVVASQPCLLNGLIARSSVSGGDITLYEGQSADMGRKIATLVTLANVPLAITFPHAPFMARGIFVDVGSNVSEVTVFFTLLPIGADKPEA